MPFLSLRGTISALAATAVAVVAIITLSITLTASLSALRSIGKTHSASLLAVAVVETENFFSKPVQAAEAMRNHTLRRSWAWPSDDWSRTGQALVDLAWTVYLECGAACSVNMYLADSTHIIIDSGGIPPGYYSMYYRYGAPYSKGGLAYQLTQPMNTENVFIYWQNHTVVPPTDPRSKEVGGVPANLLRNSTFWNTLQDATLNGYASLATGVYALVLLGEVQQYIPFVAPLYTLASPKGASNVYGFVAVAIYPSAVSGFLAAVVKDGGNAASVCYDNGGFVLGSSLEKQVPFIRVTSPKPFRTSLPDGCASTGDLADISSATTVYLSCRTHISAYSVPALRSIAADESLAFVKGRAVQMLQDSGEVYYVAVSEVRLQYGGMGLWIALLLPEADVIGDVVTGRNTAIGITCAVFVVIAVLSFVMISLLLAPLQAVADRMMRAASLDDDDTNRELSAMAEVEDLQQAYYAMNDELVRIRSFVPQTVLRPKKAEIESESEPDEVVRQTTEQGSNRSRRSGSQARSADRKSAVAEVAASTGLNVACGLTTASVSVLVANLNGFEAAADKRSRDAVVSGVGETVAFVQEVAGANKGVLQSFHGDHFIVTFNAVMPCAAHARRAATVALHLAKGSRELGLKLGLRAGVASGRCAVGNVGSATAKAFSTIGPAFVHASLLERMTRLYGSGCRVLAPARTCIDIATHIRFRYVDIVRLPQSKAVTLVGALLEELQLDLDAAQGGNKAHDGGAAGHDGEWLYVLEQGKGVDGSINEAFTALLEGRVEAARRLGEHLQDTDVCEGDVNSRVLEVLRVAQEAPKEDLEAGAGKGSSLTRGMARDLGSLYRAGYNVQ